MAAADAKEGEQEGGLFSRIANEVYEATELISNRVEEGVAALMGGDSSKASAEQQHDAPPLDPEEQLLMDEEMMGSPLEGIAQSVIGDIMGGQVGPQTPKEHIQAFCAAINWKEPFILSILVFQVLAFVLCMWAVRPSRGLAARISVMVSIGVLVRCAELMNSYGAKHWEEFATQNYFDQRGIFIGIFVCAPLMLDCFLMLAFYMREASQLLVQVKTTELRKKKEAEKKEKEKREKKRVSKKRD